MATLNEIAFNIKNIVEGGVGSDDSNLSTRQIKYLVHTKRAEILLKYTDNGRKTSEASYQVDILNIQSTGANYKPYLGFNADRAIRSIAYKESNDLEEEIELLPIVQNHDRMFVQQSRFIRNTSKKYATFSDGKVFVYEDDSILSDGILEFKAM